CTLPGRSAHRSRSPSWLNTNRGWIAGAREMTVVRGPLLRAVGRAHAAVDVEYQRRPSPPRPYAVDPPPREVVQRRQILLVGHRARLEAPHLARRCGVLRHRASADDPPHRGVAPEAVRVVHVLVPASRPNTAWRNWASSMWRPFFPVRGSVRFSAASAVRPR